MGLRRFIFWLLLLRFACSVLLFCLCSAADMAIEVFERWNISWYFEDFGHEVLLSFTDNAAVEKLCRHNRPAIDVFNDPRFVDARLRKTAKIAKHKSINPAPLRG
jgi:hypothetical protein